MRVIHEAGCPAGVVNAWNGPAPLAQKVLVEDNRIRMLSFTGSVPVGWKLKELLPDRRVVLELGGNASALVHEDADLDWAVRRIVAGGYGYAGQVCIAVQHVLVHRSRLSEAREALVTATEACPWGDPALEATVCGPLISIEAADKVQAMVDEAVAAGARRLAGGERRGALMQPTLLENVPPACRLSTEEVFGPVLTLGAYDDLNEAIERVNGSSYGIQAGVFTHDLRVADRAFRRLEVGGVVINDYPTLRFDNVPYGGTKRSGFGREGVRYAMDEMTDPKAMLIQP